MLQPNNNPELRSRSHKMKSYNMIGCYSLLLYLANVLKFIYQIIKVFIILEILTYQLFTFA